MVWQLSVVGLIVAASALYLTRRAWRTWGRKGSGCGGGCGSGCKGESPSASGQAPRLIPADQLLVRRREEN
jgi:hypothetical protein